MSMKVLIISTSLRTNSNSDILARKCVRGALDAGHEVEYVSLKGKSIEYCIVLDVYLVSRVVVVY